MTGWITWNCHLNKCRHYLLSHGRFALRWRWLSCQGVDKCVQPHMDCRSQAISWFGWRSRVITLFYQWNWKIKWNVKIFWAEQSQRWNVASQRQPSLLAGECRQIFDVKNKWRNSVQSPFSRVKKILVAKNSVRRGQQHAEISNRFDLSSILFFVLLLGAKSKRI